MTTITEDYVSFETAKLLKEKGFDKKLRYYYDTDGILVRCHRGEYFSNKSNAFIAPTQAMAMKWLREVYKLYVEVYIVRNYSNKTVEYCITIEDLNFSGNTDGFHIRPPQESYEQACEAAIKYCLENLI